MKVNCIVGDKFTTVKSFLKIDKIPSKWVSFQLTYATPLYSVESFRK